MIENYKDAIEEFKRVDHLYHVSLKYTRTVDVIRSVIERIVSTYEYAIVAYLRCLVEEKKIGEYPDTPVGRAQLAIEQCESEIFCNYMQHYLRMRKILRCEYSKRDEFRRHVTMIVDFEGETLNIDIDKLKEHYDEVKEFLRYLKGRVECYKGEDD